MLESLGAVNDLDLIGCWRLALVSWEDMFVLCPPRLD